MQPLYSTSEIDIALNRSLFNTCQTCFGKKHWSNFLAQHGIFAFKSNRMLVHDGEELCPCVRSDRPHIDVGKSIYELLQFDRVKQCAIATIDCSRRVTTDRFIRWSIRIAFLKIRAEVPICGDRVGCLHGLLDYHSAAWRLTLGRLSNRTNLDPHCRVVTDRCQPSQELVLALRGVNNSLNAQ